MYTTDLENYEKSEAGAVSLVAVDDSDSDDSGPDVIIEQEEVIGSVGLPAAPPGGQNTRTQTTPDTHSLSRTGISNDNGTLREDLRHDEDSLQADAPVNKTISDDMSKMSITTPSDAILPAPTSDSKLPVTTPDKTLPASAREKELPNGDNNTLPTTTSNDTALFDSRNMLPAMTHSSYSTHGQTSVPVVGDGVSNQVKSGDIQGNSQPLGAAGTSVPAVSNSVSNQVSYFSFQLVLHDWCNTGHGMCYPVCGMVHIKEPLMLIDKSSLCGGSGFPFSLLEWSLTICLTPYNRR